MWLFVLCFYFFFFKQKTPYDMRISDWSSDVCASDLPTSWPAWAQRRSALCRRALSSDTASSSDKPEQRRRRCVAADRPAQIVSSSHPVGLSLVDNRDRGPIRLPLHQT